jgi:hypothetical protein
MKILLRWDARAAVSQRIDSGGCLKLMLSRTKQRTRGHGQFSPVPSARDDLVN